MLANLGDDGELPANRSSVKAMLANLGNDEEMPSLQSGTASPPRGGLNVNNIPDIDADEGQKHVEISPVVGTLLSESAEIDVCCVVQPMGF